MRIGIITYWNSTDNYGQQLQCYALQAYLKDLGHDAFLIRYTPKKEDNSVIHRLLFPVKWCADLLIPQRRKRKKQIAESKEIWENVVLKNKIRNFEDFRVNFLSQSSNVYHSISELRRNPPVAELYITGSDQVWNNPLSDFNTAGWYLDFGSKDTVRASYAASIGRTVTDEEKPIFKVYLSKFNKISVRENKALDLCKSQGFNDAIVVVDPTLLLNKSIYEKIYSDSLYSDANPYIFIYIINIRTSKEIYWPQIESFANAHNLEVKSVSSSGYLPACDIIPNHVNIMATIPEWLELISRSTVVFTTSFHGIVFSILFHKPFYAILLNNEYAKGNDRIATLLKELGLEDRMVSKDSALEFCTENNIDWDVVDKKLETVKAASMKFIDDVLSSVIETKK